VINPPRSPQSGPPPKQRPAAPAEENGRGGESLPFLASRTRWPFGVRCSPVPTKTPARPKLSGAQGGAGMSELRLHRGPLGQGRRYRARHDRDLRAALRIPPHGRGAAAGAALRPRAGSWAWRERSAGAQSMADASRPWSQRPMGPCLAASRAGWRRGDRGSRSGVSPLV
jgi:hypothetical protein